MPVPVIAFIIAMEMTVGHAMVWRLMAASMPGRSG
jgi:hypothetical protein